MITWQGKLKGYENFNLEQIKLLNELEAILPMEFMSVGEWVSSANCKGLITFDEWSKLDDQLCANEVKHNLAKLNA